MTVGQKKGEPKNSPSKLTSSIKRIVIRIHQTLRRVQINRILHINHLPHRIIPIIQRRQHIHIHQRMQHNAKHAPDQRLVVRRRPIGHDRRTTRRPQRWHYVPERRTYHYEFRMAPRHQRRERGSRVPRQTLGPQVGGEVVAFLHASKGRRRGGPAETRGAVGGDE